MFDAVISLISKTCTQNAVGANVVTESKREVFCNVSSVGRSEFYQAMQAGHGLSYVFTTHPINYEGEEELEYNGERYGITRTYQSGLDSLDIYAGTKVGDFIGNGSDEGGQSDTI